jgi:hypothetical protein
MTGNQGSHDWRPLVSPPGEHFKSCTFAQQPLISATSGEINWVIDSLSAKNLKLRLKQ